MSRNDRSQTLNIREKIGVEKVLLKKKKCLRKKVSIFFYFSFTSFKFLHDKTSSISVNFKTIRRLGQNMVIDGASCVAKSVYDRKKN